MPKRTDRNGIYRILDANINRTKEGLRVCEEVTRFILDSQQLTAAFKAIRHRIDGLVKTIRQKPELLAARKSREDVGLRIRSKSEFKRCDYKDIFFANMQRVKESIRVLEEFSKLDDVKSAFAFRNLRYDIYELEKKVIKKFKSVCDRQ